MFCHSMKATEQYFRVYCESKKLHKVGVAFVSLGEILKCDLLIEISPSVFSRVLD